MTSPILTSTAALPTKTNLGPLTSEQRVSILAEARGLNAEGRRIYKRLLILAQERVLSADAITHSAAQAREHMAAFA